VIMPCTEGEQGRRTGFRSLIRSVEFVKRVPEMFLKFCCDSILRVSGMWYPSAFIPLIARFLYNENPTHICNYQMHSE
jgi:hypothetical protein